MTICKNNHLLGVVLTGILLSLPMSSSAKCGGVDYSWGADALSNAHDYTVTMMLYVVYLSYAIAGLVAVIGALQIYLPMVGLMGIDWAYGFDKVFGSKGGSQFHFILGQEF